jgi:hypothetical protein
MCCVLDLQHSLPGSNPDTTYEEGDSFVTMASLTAKAPTQVHGISSIGVGRVCCVNAVPVPDLS